MACSLPSGESINEEFLSCPICNEVFDEELFTPRNLPCGHTICSLCVEKVIQSLYKHCPECRKVINVQSSTDLPICYIATRIVRNIKKQKVEEKETILPPAEEFSQDGTNSITDSNKSWKAEPKLASKQPLQNISISLEALFGSNNYLKRLEEKTIHEVESIDECISKLKTEVLDNESNIKDIKCHLKHEEVRVQKMTEFSSLFDDLDLRIALSGTITDLDEIVEEVLEARESAEALLKDDEHLCALEEFIGDRVIKEQFERCRQLYAEQLVNGIKKYARVSQCGDHVLLHLLRALPQPNVNSAIMQYGEIRARVPRLPTVSLYLYWEGSMQGVVKFSLNNCLHGHHFAAMCLGDRGKSFLNAVLFGSLDEGVLASHPSLSGPSLVTDATPSAAPLPGCVRASTNTNEGLLVAQVLEPTNDAFGAFKIDTQRKGGERGPLHIFGKCVAGLNVLRSLADREKVDDVMIKDCGVFVDSF